MLVIARFLQLSSATHADKHMSIALSMLLIVAETSAMLADSIKSVAEDIVADT